MHSVEALEAALDLAERLGYGVRQEWLGGAGGACVLRGRKVLFVDLALAPADQLAQVLDALGGEPQAAGLPMPHQLRQMLALRKSA